MKERSKKPEGSEPKKVFPFRRMGPKGEKPADSSAQFPGSFGKPSSSEGPINVTSLFGEAASETGPKSDPMDTVPQPKEKAEPGTFTRKVKDGWDKFNATEARKTFLEIAEDDPRADARKALWEAEKQMRRADIRRDRLNTGLGMTGAFAVLGSGLVWAMDAVDDAINGDDPQETHINAPVTPGTMHDCEPQRGKPGSMFAVERDCPTDSGKDLAVSVNPHKDGTETVTFTGGYYLNRSGRYNGLETSISGDPKNPSEFSLKDKKDPNKVCEVKLFEASPKVFKAQTDC